MSRTPTTVEIATRWAAIRAGVRVSPTAYRAD
jgi:hypothetical protein